MHRGTVDFRFIRNLVLIGTPNNLAKMHNGNDLLLGNEETVKRYVEYWA